MASRIWAPQFKVCTQCAVCLRHESADNFLFGTISINFMLSQMISSFHFTAAPRETNIVLGETLRYKSISFNFSMINYAIQNMHESEFGDEKKSARMQWRNSQTAPNTHKKKRSHPFYILLHLRCDAMGWDAMRWKNPISNWSDTHASAWNINMQSHFATQKPGHTHYIVSLQLRMLYKLIFMRNE